MPPAVQQSGTAAGGADDTALIVTADDFGGSREINTAIVEAHRQGILTAASLMAGAAARDEAAAAARENPGLDVGLHVVVCRGSAVLAPQQLAGIADARGNFAENPVLAGMSYFFNRSIRAALRDELRAQIETHLRLVGTLHHIDGHLNFHVHPVIARLLIELAVEYKVPCMRLPREPVLATLRLARDHAARKLVEAAIFRALSRRARRMMAAHGIRTSDWLFGLHQSGHLTEDYILGVIRLLRPGLNEIYFHPAIDIGDTPPPAAAQRDARILTSPAVRDALEAARVRLTSFAEIVRAQPQSAR